MKLTPLESFFTGLLAALMLITVLLPIGFVSKDVLKLGEFYMDGKFYKRCEVK